MKDLVSSDREVSFNIKQRLKMLGASAFVLSRAEVRKLPQLLHKDENIEACIYGSCASGWAMLVATDRKLIFVNNMFLDLKVDELPFSMISAVDHSYGHVFSKVTVHTRAKDYAFKYVNRKCANRFVEYIEERIIQLQDEYLRNIAEEQFRVSQLNHSNTLQLPVSYDEQQVINRAK